MVSADDKDEGMNAVTLYKIIRDSNTSSNYNDSVIVIEETTGKLCSSESLNIGAVRDFTEHVRLREHTLYMKYMYLLLKKKSALILLVFRVLRP